jgi:hypothetical protein
MATETYSLSIQGVHKQERNECVIHFKGDGLTADDTWESGKDLIDSWIDTPMGTWLALMPTTYYIDRLVARRAHPKGLSTEYHTQFQNGEHAGTISGGAQTQQLCPVVRLIPGTGVKTMGKVFLPCIAEGSINGNVYQAAYLTAIDDHFPQIIGNFGIGPIQWNVVVYSRKLDLVSPIVSYLISPAIGYQRRRRAPV